MWWIVGGAALGALIGVAYWRSRRSGATTAADPITPTVVTPASPARVLLIGDSHAQGLRYPLGAVVRGHSTEYKGEGLPGAGAIHWTGTSLAGQPPRDVAVELAAFHPTVVLISLGGNDYQAAWRTQKTEDAVTKIVSQVQQAGAVPVWLEPPKLPFADKIGVTDMWLKSGAVRFPSYDLTLPRVKDGIHLTLSGYRQWSEIIWAWLKEQGLVA